MQKLSPLEWAVRPLMRYAQFSGRAPRAEYWWFYLSTVVVGLPLRIFDSAFSAHWTLRAFQLAVFVPWIAASVRRLHDINRSGKWMFILVVPFLILGAMMWVINQSPNFGKTPGEFTSLIVFAIVALVAFFGFLASTVLPGTKGPNDYGPDPYGDDDLEEVFA